MEEKGSIGQFTKIQRKDSLFRCYIGNDDDDCYGPRSPGLVSLESHAESVPVITLQKGITVKEQVTESILICREHS